MTTLLNPPRTIGALRVLAMAGSAALLGGCVVAQQVSGELPSDYRNRHPIVLREGPRT